MTESHRLRRACWAIIFVGSAALFVGQAETPLWDQDEAAYAGFAHTMLQTGDWIMPRYWWSDVHRKPPLHFWLTAASFRLLGENTVAARAPAALAYVLTLLLMARWGAPLFGATTSLLAAAVMASSLTLIVGRLGITDGPLLLAQTGACLALLRFFQGPDARWALAAWGFLAAGMLIKGPPALILVSGMLGGLALLSPHRRRLPGLRPWLGIPAAAAPLLVWGWATWQADDGALVRWMLDWYVLERRSGVFGQTAPPGAYFLSFALFLFPWFWFLPAALVRAFDLRRRRRPRTYSLLPWLAAGWLFYELAPSKLPTYVLGAYPALAFLIATEIRRVDRTGLTPLHAVGLVVHVLVLLGLAVACFLAPSFPGVTHALPFAAAGSWLLLFGAGGVFLIAAGHLRPGLLTTATASLGLVLILGGWGVAALKPRLHATAIVADQVSRVARPPATVGLPPRLGLPSLPLALTWHGLTPVLDSPADFRITTEAPLQTPLAVADGWIPDRGRAVRYWIVAGR